MRQLVTGELEESFLQRAKEKAVRFCELRIRGLLYWATVSGDGSRAGSVPVATGYHCPPNRYERFWMAEERRGWFVFSREYEVAVPFSAVGYRHVQP